MTDLLTRIQHLATELGRTPTQKELRGLGINNHRQRELLIQAGIAPREGHGGKRERKAPLDFQQVVREDAVGIRLARTRLLGYRVVETRRDELNPLATWML